jgi:excisionase family DNA binding protein
MEDFMETKDIPANLRFYSTQDIAELLKMNIQVIARKLACGEIVGYKIGKDWRVSEKDLLVWIEKHSNQRRGKNKAVNVIDNFIKNGRVKSLPAQRKKRRYVLEYILKEFKTDKVYSESEVNEIIQKFYDDFCTVRREFIIEQMMTRANGRYHRNSSYKNTG